MNEPEEEEDFEKLFEASTKAKRFEKGQTIEGTIVTIGAEVALIDVGGKSEAEIDVAELKDDEGDIEVAVGDRIQAVVLSTAGGLKLSRRLARGAATSQQLESAFRAGLPVEGKVEKAVKGGYEVRIARQRAFCPFSQIDIIPNTDPASHEGRVYEFRIIEYKDNRNLVVSRRVLLEEQQRANAAEVRKSIVEGAVLSGRVVSVREFGAFVDLGGGIQGLLHVSEMAWARVSDTAQVVKPGDQITVKVLRLDKDKISLGLKQLMADPWSKALDTYAVGQRVQGSCDARRRLRRLRRARAGSRGTDSVERDRSRERRRREEGVSRRHQPRRRRPRGGRCDSPHPSQCDWCPEAARGRRGSGIHRTGGYDASRLIRIACGQTARRAQASRQSKQALLLGRGGSLDPP